jgi:hypothetical protein
MRQIVESQSEPLAIVFVDVLVGVGAGVYAGLFLFVKGVAQRIIPRRDHLPFIWSAYHFFVPQYSSIQHRFSHPQSFRFHGT